jgi:hypothetical protein
VCEYCEKEAIIFEQNHMGLDGPWTFDPDAKATRKDYEAFEYRQGIYIDTRGYLRMVDMDDCQCLDHGHNLKISFCPICGRDMRATPAEGTTRIHPCVHGAQITCEICCGSCLDRQAGVAASDSAEGTTREGER